ncbi:hypothetical protein MauCBS54593_000654 [Microsporum audouinii]
MHGKWTEAEDVAIVAFRLGTNLGWEGIKAKFDASFPQASCKDLESRWNKSLRPTPSPGDRKSIADAFDDFRHYRPSHIADGRERRLVLAVLRVLADHPDERIVPPHPELESSGDQGLQPEDAVPSSQPSGLQSALPTDLPQPPTVPEPPQPAVLPDQADLGAWLTQPDAPWDTGVGHQQGLGSADPEQLLRNSELTTAPLESPLFVQQDDQLPAQTYSPYSQLQQLQPAQPAQPAQQQQSQPEHGLFDPNIDPLLYEYP